MITALRSRTKGRKLLGQAVSLVLLAGIGWLGFQAGRHFQMMRPHPGLPARGPQLDIHVLDVGKGVSELLMTPAGHSILIDAGSRDQPAVEASSLLGAKDTVDLVILTSTRPNAIGGLRALLDAVKVDGPVLLPGDSTSFRRAGRTARDVLAALHEHGIVGIPYDQYMLAHPTPLAGEPNLQLAGLPVVSRYNHALSMAVRVEYGSSALLYAAGIDSDGERDLLSRNSNLACDVLSIPAGESGNSAPPEILAASGPQVIVISCDRYNRPGDETQRWLEASGARVGRTDLLGSFSLHLDPMPNQGVKWTYTPSSSTQ